VLEEFADRAFVVPQKPAEAFVDGPLGAVSCSLLAGSATRSDVAKHNCERNHQGLGNRLICGGGPQVVPVARIATRRRLGGPLNVYHDAATA
jgi:hypothetical protein